ncbi:hypothetical protein EV178_002123 [Coemansia sp. RSA 1646]|nr:hypothetical protein EV178_002123 [Coemansia sp. RSA 1646]
MRLVKSDTFHDSDAARDKKKNALPTRSLPNIALSLPDASDNAKGYIDRYAADSYSSYDTDDSFELEPEPEPEDFVGEEQDQQAHRSDGSQSPAAQDTAVVLSFEPAALRLPTTKIVYNPEPKPTELPSRLVRGATARKPPAQEPYAKAQHNQQHNQRQNQQQNQKQQQQLTPTPQYVLEEDEFNGLLAPGAFADEGQRAQADGGKFRRLISLLAGGNRKEREASLFKPVVFDPKRKRTADISGGGGDDGDAAPQEGEWVKWLCCPARFCVASTFVGILVGAVIGFFIWPRVPSLSVSSLTALQPARVIYDTERNQFGLHMPMRITYEIHSGNFYPLRINGAHVLGFDGVTGNRIVDTRLSNLRVAPLQMQFHSENATVHYMTSDMTDPALTDLFGKCAPQASAAFSTRPEGRPGALTIRFQIKVDVANLGWFGKQPIVTLNQNVECPE